MVMNFYFLNLIKNVYSLGWIFPYHKWIHVQFKNSKDVSLAKQQE